MRPIAITSLLLLLAHSATAQTIQYPVDIPFECQAVAQREGYPLRITSYAEGLYYKLKLLRLKNKDLIVMQCLDVIRAYEALQEAQRKGRLLQ